MAIRHSTDKVKRDAAAFNLRCVDRPVIDAELREREHLLSAAVTVATSAEIEQLYAEFQGAGVAFHQPLERQPWERQEFHHQGLGRKPAAVRRPGGMMRLGIASLAISDRIGTKS